jgi:alpha-beta hydrolase superfamily lysophospholipase
MEYALPQPPDESGRLDGIAYDLWLPLGADPSPAVLIFHGAGSQKANHVDFARAATSHGFVALTFDNRGHGQSDGKLGGRAVTDAERLVHALAERPEVDERRIAVRGSSMGGLLAIHLAAVSKQVAAAVAICPAAEHMMIDDLRRLARGEPPPPGSALESIRVDAPALVAWLEEHDVREAIELLGTKPLMLVHARDDEVIPWEFSRELYQRAEEPKRLLLLEGGNHRSAQHDSEVQGETLRWLHRVMRPAVRS